ncbi:MAG TPA: hypothetical protein VL123_03795 [Candidatus Udaeobacter sp.]|jgi:hypothetical protein|nr:hypothetical protein [Candidatus Udaeobacter sp.]
MPAFHSRHTTRSLALGAITALILGAPAVVMAQESPATKAPDKPAEAKAASEKVEAKAVEAKTETKATEKAEEKTESNATEKAEKSADDRAKMMSERFDRMTKSLKLTDEQKEKVRPIMVEEMTRARAMREKFEGKPMTAETHAAMEKEHKELWAEEDAKLAQVLTPDQMTELKKMRAEHMKHKDWSKEKEKEEKTAK